MVEGLKHFEASTVHRLAVLALYFIAQEQRGGLTEAECAEFDEIARTLKTHPPGDVVQGAFIFVGELARGLDCKQLQDISARYGDYTRTLKPGGKVRKVVRDDGGNVARILSWRA